MATHWARFVNMRSTPKEILCLTMKRIHLDTALQKLRMGSKFPVNMRTGHSLTGERTADPNLELNVTAMVLAFTEKAVKRAATYVEHSGRTVVTKGDLRKGMASEYFAFLRDATLEEDVAEWRSTIQRDLDCCTCESDDDEEIPENEDGELICPRCSKVVIYEDVSEISDEEPPPEESGGPGTDRTECQCDICVTFPTAEDQLLHYVPDDPMAALLREHILLMDY